MYSLFALLTALSMYLFMALIEKPGRLRNAIWLAVVNVLLVYSHFFGFFVLGVQLCLVLVIGDIRKAIFRNYFLIVLAVLLAFAPYLPLMISRFGVAADQGTWISRPVISDLYTMVWRYLNAPVVTVAVLAVLVLAAIQFFLCRRKGGDKLTINSIVVLSWFFLPYVGMFLISFRIPIFLDRYTVFVSVGFAQMAGMAFSRLAGDSGIRTGLLSVILVMMAVTFHPNVFNKRKLKEAVSFISSHKDQGTSVILCPEWLQYGYAYHYNQVLFAGFQHFREDLEYNSIFPANDITGLDTTRINKAGQVLVFEEWASLTDPSGSITNYLGRHFRFSETTLFYENFKVHRYIK